MLSIKFTSKKKTRLLLVGGIVTKKVPSVFYKFIGRRLTKEKFVDKLGEFFEVNIFSYTDRALYDLSPYKVYVIDFPKIVYRLLKETLRSDIIVCPGYGAVLEPLICYLSSRIRGSIFIIKDTHWYWRQTFLSKMFFHIYYKILTGADAIIVPGKASFKYWKSYGLRNIFIVHYYWLESNMLGCREIPKQLLKLRNSYDIVVMYLGRLIEKRGLDILMKAFSTIVKKYNVNIALIIAGTGPLSDRLRALARDLKIEEKTIFLGPVSENTKECLYRITDVFVYVPIITQLPEEWPIPPLEAMKVGVPTIISSATGSAPDLLPGVIVVKWGSVEELVKALELIIFDKNLRNLISKKAIEIAHKIDVDSVIVELLSTIKEIAKNKRKYL